MTAILGVIAYVLGGLLTVLMATRRWPKMLDDKKFDYPPPFVVFAAWPIPLLILTVVSANETLIRLGRWFVGMSTSDETWDDA